MKLPKPNSLYYHYKRDPQKGVNHGAYLIKGVAIDRDDRSQSYVITKPLYYCDPRHSDEKGKSFFARRLEDFLSPALKNGTEVERFVEITDTRLIQEISQHELFSSDFLDQ